MADLDPAFAALRQARQERGWSLVRAEAEIGVPAVVIGSYERGDRNPSIARLRHILAAYGRDLVVIGGEGEHRTSWTEYAVEYGQGGRIDCDTLDEAQGIAAHMVDGRVVWRRVHADGWRSS